jgi:thioredoxin reductase (NADPH)
MISAGDLAKVPLFDCLSEAQRERLAASVAELNVEAGEWIIREGETPSFLVLLEGAVDVEKEYGGASKVRGSYKPGDFYGKPLFSWMRLRSLRSVLPNPLAWCGSTAINSRS